MRSSADTHLQGFNVELIGPDGKQLSELRPQAIFRVQLYTIRRTHFTPNELLHEPTSPAVVYLVERDHGEVDLTDPDSPICSDFSGRNVTVMSPEGAWLIKYREREHFEKDEEHEEEFLVSVGDEQHL